MLQRKIASNENLQLNFSQNDNESKNSQGSSIHEFQ
jgi:hypothetical protein